MIGHQYYILEGTTPVPTTTAIWAQWFEHAERHVEDTLFVDGVVRVSTVFLGLNHQFGDGPPLLFETMCFGLDDRYGTPQWRYSTWTEAEQGHAHACAVVRRLLARARERDRRKLSRSGDV